MGHNTVLVIDDEPYNIKLIQNDLESKNYHVLTATDGVEGWDVLEKNHDQIDVILLDRMMPNMDGMELLGKIKESSAYTNIPVIMQTAAAEKEQVIEGIDAGVYYYLTKPYDYGIMLSIVRSACDDHNHYKQLWNDLKVYKSRLHLINKSSFSVRTLDDVRFLSTFLSNFYPDPDRVVLGISELLINAIEHGNLGISYEDKSELNAKNGWRKEIERRLSLPEHQDQYAEVEYEKTRDRIILRIKDQGEGFNWQDYLFLSADRATDSHGRGIAMTKMISFDEIEYIGCGNEVTCCVYIKKSS